MEKSKLILASTSTFRRALLERTMMEFEALAPLCDEEALKKEFNGAPKELCSFLALKKTESLQSAKPQSVIIGSDQSLFLEDQSFDKPQTVENAIKQLELMSGKTAELITAVCILETDENSHIIKKIEFTNTTKLFFKKLSTEQISSYVNEDLPLKSAGSFMFEKKGLFLFEKIDCSDPTSIEGLPLMQLTIELESLGFKLDFL